jgi:hypothetical protein
MNRYKPVGWRNESQRHSLAARGLTKRGSFTAYRGPIGKNQFVMSDIPVSKFIPNSYDYAKEEIKEDILGAPYIKQKERELQQVEMHNEINKLRQEIDNQRVLDESQRRFQRMLDGHPPSFSSFAFKFKVGDDVRIKEGAKALEEKSFYELSPEQRKHVVDNFFEGKYTGDQEKEIVKKINEFYDKSNFAAKFSFVRGQGLSNMTQAEVDEDADKIVKGMYNKLEKKVDITNDILDDRERRSNAASEAAKKDEMSKEDLLATLDHWQKLKDDDKKLEDMWIKKELNKYE